MSKVSLAFIIPPPDDQFHRSWRAIVYTKEPPEKLFVGRRTYPSFITPDPEIMKRELCDPDHIPAFVVQLTTEEQYVYIEGDVCEILSTEVHFADSVNDPYLRKTPTPKPKQAAPSLILPGQALPGQPSGSQPTLVTNVNQPAGSSADLEDAYVVDITFKNHEVKDPSIVNKVKTVAWNHGLSI